MRAVDSLTNMFHIDVHHSLKPEHIQDAIAINYSTTLGIYRDYYKLNVHTSMHFMYPCDIMCLEAFLSHNVWLMTH